MRVTVVGAGYVGLVTAACLGRMGHRVAILETKVSRLETLLQGQAPFHEPGLHELISDTTTSGALRPLDDPAEALANPDIVLVCVGTPITPDGKSDLSQVIAACTTIAEHAPDVPIVMRSTLPLGTTHLLSRWLQRGAEDTIVTNPEFLRQGSAIADFMKPTRIVIGTATGEVTAPSELLVQLYDGFSAPVVLTDYDSAEMIKNVANAFLATKLSFINEVADLCEVYGADIEDVVTGIGLDPRIGASYLRPGIGFGGSCLPKELANIVRLGAERGLAIPLMQGAAQTNDARPERIADRIEELVGELAGCRVALLGLAFKPNTDDLRYSPALALGRELARRSALVNGHDQAVPMEATDDVAWLTRVRRPEDAIAGADLVVLATEWPAYEALAWKELATQARRAIVFDGRNALDRDALQQAGWRVINVGRNERSGRVPMEVPS